MTEVINPIHANLDVLGFYHKQKSEFHFQEKSDNEFLMFLLDTAVRVISIVQHLAPVIEAVSDASAEEAYEDYSNDNSDSLSEKTMDIDRIDKLAGEIAQHQMSISSTPLPPQVTKQKQYTNPSPIPLSSVPMSIPAQIPVQPPAQIPIQIPAQVPTQTPSKISAPTQIPQQQNLSTPLSSQTTSSQPSTYQSSTSQDSTFQSLTSQASTYQSSTSQASTYQSSISQASSYQPSTSQASSYQPSTSQASSEQPSITTTQSLPIQTPALTTQSTSSSDNTNNHSVAEPADNHEDDIADVKAEAIPEVVIVKDEIQEPMQINNNNVEHQPLLPQDTLNQLMNSINANEENIGIANLVTTAQPSNLPQSFLEKSNNPLSMLSLSNTANSISLLATKTAGLSTQAESVPGSSRGSATELKSLTDIKGGPSNNSSNPRYRMRVLPSILNQHPDAGQCPFCPKYFNRKLKRHMEAVHFRLRPYRCPFPECTATFAYSFAIKKHIRVAHSEDK